MFDQRPHGSHTRSPARLPEMIPEGASFDESKKLRACGVPAGSCQPLACSCSCLLEARWTPLPRRAYVRIGAPAPWAPWEFIRRLDLATETRGAAPTRHDSRNHTWYLRNRASAPYMESSRPCDSRCEIVWTGTGRARFMARGDSLLAGGGVSGSSGFLGTFPSGVDRAIPIGNRVLVPGASFCPWDS